MTVSSTWKSWTIQRILNRFPLWSRARTRDDSVARFMLNPMCIWMDEIFENLLSVRRNYFITTVDTIELEKLYHLELDNDFTFTESGNAQGQIQYSKPTITGTIDATNYSVTVSDKTRLQNITKSEVVPTRLSATRLLSSFSDSVLSSSLLNLASATINDDYIDYLGYVYVEVDNAVEFGELLPNGKAVVPKVIITGTPWHEDVERKEHIIFRSNSEIRSLNRWQGITNIDTNGIYDSAATLRVHSGFNKRAVQEPLAFFEDELKETRLLYDYSNQTFNGNQLPTIQFLIPEITDPSLRRQGYNDDVLEYEFGVMSDQTTYLTNPLVGIERMPFTRWLLLADKDSLHVVSARMPHMFNWLREDSNGINIVITGLQDRTVGAELIVEAERNWTNFTEDATSFAVSTDHIKPVRGILSTRMSITYDSPGLGATTTVYYDWNGNTININTDPANGWIHNSVSTALADDWKEKHFTVDVSSVLTHPAWVAVLKLEVEYNDREIEIDTFVLHSDIRTVETSIDWPTAIKGKVNGITYDAKNRLLVTTTDNELWDVETYWDYCVVDYVSKIVYLREDYDSVEVTS